MPTGQPCPRCGDTDYSEEEKLDFGGECPKCLALVAFEDPTPAPEVTVPAADQAPPLEAGTEFQGYEIQEVLGRGGMGIVYRARQKSLGRPVALKILSPRLARSEEFVLRFRREAKLLAALNHPNVVRVYEFGESDGLLYLAMEFVEGSTLLDSFNRRSLKTSDLLDLLARACDGLERIHRAGLVHRDIKPGNIIINPEGEPKIADFGLAVQTQDSRNLTETGALLGTPHYMSPEQVQGGQIDGRSDLYSLGILLYQGLAGRLPFEGSTPTAVLVKHVEESPPLLREFVSDLPPGLEELTLGLLSKYPGARPGTAQALRKSLARAAEEARNWEIQGPLTRARELTRSARRPGRRVYGVAAAILLIGAFAFFSYRRRDPAPPAPPAPPRPPVAESKVPAARDVKPVRVAPIVLSLKDARWTLTGTVRPCGWDEYLQRLFINGNGGAVLSADVPLEGDYEIVVRASGDPLFNIGAEFRVLVDGQTVGPAMVASTGARDCRFKAWFAAGKRSITVQFTNDENRPGEGDRNLYIHGVRLVHIASGDVNPSPTGGEPGKGTPPIDLLGLLDTSRHSTQGEWIFNGGSLVSRSPSHLRASIAMPFRPPPEYDLRLTVRRLPESTAGLDIGLVSGGRRFAATLEDGITGPSLIKGVRASRIEPHFVAFFQPGQDRRILCEVRKTGVKVHIDGNTVISWSGRPEQLSLDPRIWNLPEETELFLSCHSRAYEFTSVTLHPLGPSGTIVRDQLRLPAFQEPEWSIPDHVGRLWSLAFSADGGRLATGGDDGIVRIRDLKTQGETLLLAGNQKGIESVAISPDGRLAASGGRDRSARIWDLRTGRQLHHLVHDDAVPSVAFSPDGKSLLTGSLKGMRLWDVASGAEIRRFDHQAGVYETAFSPGGKLALSAGGPEGGIKVWNLESGNVSVRFDGHRGEIRGAVFTPDGRQVISASQDDTVRVWDLESKKEVEQYPVTEGTARMEGVAVSPDGKIILACRGDTLVIDRTSRKIVGRLAERQYAARCAAFYPGGPFAATGGGDGKVSLWRIQGPWRPLFDGTSLDVMRAESRTAWKVEDKALVRIPGSPTSALQSQETFEDGEIRIRFKVSLLFGMSFRVRQGEGGSYGVTWDSTHLPLLDAENELVFTCRGDAVTATLNGSPIKVDQDRRPRSGAIQLQCPDSVRGLRILGIDYSPIRPGDGTAPPARPEDGMELILAPGSPSQGMTVVPQGDGAFEFTTDNGKPCARLLENKYSPSRYLYFALNDRGPVWERAEVEVEYLDEGGGYFALEFDGITGSHTFAPQRVWLLPSQTWKQATFTLTDPIFQGRENGNTDFRLNRSPGSDLKIHRVRLRRYGPKAPEPPRPLGPPPEIVKRPAGPESSLRYEYFEGVWSKLPDFDRERLVSKGIARQLDLSQRERDTNFGIRYTGFIDIPVDGVYTFTTVSDDGSKLFIGKTEVVSNDFNHGVEERSGTLVLAAGTYPLTVTFYQGGGPFHLEVFWKGPGFAKQPIPANALGIGPPVNLSEGLVGHWTLDDSTAADATGRSGAAKVVGAVGWEAGRIGGAARFDGSGGYLELPNSDELDRLESGNYTLAAWFKPEDVPPGQGAANNAGYAILIKQEWSEGLVFQNDRKFALGHWIEEGKPGPVIHPVVTWNDAYGPAVWYHLAGVVDRDSGKLRIYVNGESRNEVPLSPAAVPYARGHSPWRIGISKPNQKEWSWPAKGCIDDVRIYRRALDSTEVRSLYQDGTDSRPAAAAVQPVKPSGPSVDLLALIDPARDQVRGIWTLSEGVLTTPALTYAVLQVPYRPPPEYDLNLVVERKGKPESINLGLTGGGRQFMAVLDGYGGQGSGLHLVDGKVAGDNQSYRRGSCITTDKPATIRASVRKESVSVAVDGRVVILWREDSSRLTADGAWKIPDDRALSVGSYETTYRILEFKLIPVTGTGEKTR